MSSTPYDLDACLPLCGSLRTHSRYIIAHHLILHGYGHWLPNDPRGSGSREIRQRIDDISQNPVKEGWPAQNWSFAQPYGGWPRSKKRGC